MKQFVSLVGAIGFVVSSFAQDPCLVITTAKTTSLIFPFPIKHVDRGTKDVLVQKVKEAENILLVKAAIADFPETNLSVVTGDGSVYSFVVTYEKQPVTTIYQVPVLSRTSVETYAKNLLDNPKMISGIRSHKWDMLAMVSGIYIKDKVLYYQISLANQSTLDYDIDYLRFYIRDIRKSNRTAIQETNLSPLYIAGNTSEVKAQGRTTVVVALDKFSIPDGKCLQIELGEKNGGRNLSLKVKNKKILRAITLPDVK